ncbi:hypothetical protein [Methylobacterium sp. J-077]|uniref:hypothetical protein n=1 Tax=Methylobacterium sp. J-077 TaxID=2836656 RepID=UPI001FBB3BF7|nr:hypothetical protein [Methylobacterium sp. J-077]MCJ2125617.1 hypothetical protein [Methylobacterium sp. J-077]
MSGTRKTMLAALGAFLVATTVRAAPTAGDQAGSNGPNMPHSEEVVPGDIRPRDPVDTGTVQAPGTSGARSRWQDIKRPPVRPPGL